MKVIVKVKGGDQGPSKEEQLSEADFKVDQSERKIIFKGKGYSFTHVMDSQSTQEEVYETQCSNVVKRLFEGYNGAIFVYGGSGSGKTYTMVGPESFIKNMSNKGNLQNKADSENANDSQPSDEDSKAGIIVRAMKEILNTCQSSNLAIFQISIKYFEVYNEDIYDLLSNNKSMKIDKKQKKSK